MKKIKVAKTIALAMFFYWIIYNTWFGWNMHAMSESERICDGVFKYGSAIVMIIYFLPIFDLYENKVRKSEKSK